MKNMKKMISLILVSLLALNLAACNRSGPSAAPDAGNAATVSGSQDAAGNGEPVTITYMDANAYGLDGFAALIAEYESQNPHVKIEAQNISNEYEQSLASKLNSGQLPDIFTCLTGTNATRYSEYAYDLTGHPIIEKYEESAIATAYIGERVMSVPMAFETMGMLYNKDIFEKAGIEKLPQTLDELEEVCKTLQAQGIPAFALGAADLWEVAYLVSHFIIPQNEDPEVTMAQLASGEPTFREMKNFENSFRMFDLIMEYGMDKQLEMDWEVSENNLANGNAAIIQMGDWCYNVIMDFNPDANIGMLPVPTGDDPNDAFLMNNVSWQYLVNKDSAHAEEAIRFLEFITTSEQGIQWMIRDYGVTPCAKGDFELVNAIAQDGCQFLGPQTRRMVNSFWPTHAMDMLGAEYQAYMVGSKTSEQILDNIQAGWNG